MLLKKTVLTLLMMLSLSGLRAADKGADTADDTRLLLLGDTLNGPELRCLAVQDTGHIDATWIPPNDPTNSFYCYVLYRSNVLSGPYDMVDTIWNLSASSFSDVSLQALAGSFYYISTVSEVQNQQFVEVPGDTLQSVLLVLNQTNGIVQLNWNSLYPVQQPFAAPWYQVWKKIEPGNWQLLDSLQALSFQDTINSCNADILYRIQIRDSVGCISVSNSAGGTFQDKTPPPTPKTDTVSVVNGQVQISWQQSTTQDAWGYIIFKKINNLWTPLDTIFGRLNAFFVDSLADACNSVSVYNVLAFDSCWNTSPSGKDQQNLLLNIQKSICDSEAYLSWNEYLNMRDSLKSYQVFRSVDGGAFQLLQTLPSDSTAFRDSTLADSTSYCYFVRAVNYADNRSSSSCEKCFYHVLPPAPEFVYLSVATVNHSTRNIEIRGLIDTSRFVKEIKLYRSTQPSSGYQFVSSISWSGNPHFQITDSTALVDSLVYFYQAFATDSCGNEAVGSNVVNNILLKGKAVKFMLNELSWNQAEGWYGLPAVYSVFRRAKPQNNDVTVIKNSFYGGGFLEDDVSLLYETAGDFYYYVEATESNTNQYGIKDTSMSNRVLVRQSSKVYIPNAFTPSGKNPVFKPFSVYLDVEAYQLFIYNRWGEEVFYSNDPSIGWDGSSNGADAPAGTYVYHLKYRLKNGQSQQRKGTVILLR